MVSTHKAPAEGVSVFLIQGVDPLRIKGDSLRARWHARQHCLQHQVVLDDRFLRITDLSVAHSALQAHPVSQEALPN